MRQRRWTKIGLRNAAREAGLRVIARSSFYDIGDGRNVVRVQEDGTAYRIDADLSVRPLKLSQVAGIFDLRKTRP
jgi:hypothetical protein